jgi:hypothetical protein
MIEGDCRLLSAASADKRQWREFCCTSIATIAYAEWRCVNWQRTIDARRIVLY